MLRRQKLIGRAALAAIAVGLSGGFSTARAAELPPAFGTLPADVKALYGGVEDTIQPAAYDNFTMPPKPWKWCHSESYQGNPWRVSVTNELKRLVDALSDKGWVSRLRDVRLQRRHRRSRSRRSAPSSTRAAASSPRSPARRRPQRRDRGRLQGRHPVRHGSQRGHQPLRHERQFTTIDVRATTWPRASPTSWAARATCCWSRASPGSPIVRAARLARTRLSPSIPTSSLRKVNGNWTANVTKNVVLQALATNPAPIDAVWTTGSEARIVDEAFDAGRPAAAR